MLSLKKTPQMTAKPNLNVKLDWTQIGLSGLKGLALLAGFAALLYMKSMFASHDEVTAGTETLRAELKATAAPLVNVPYRVQALESAVTKMAEAQTALAKDVGASQNTVTRLETTQRNLIENQERMFKQLDRIERKP